MKGREDDQIYKNSMNKSNTCRKINQLPFQSMSRIKNKSVDIRLRNNNKAFASLKDLLINSKIKSDFFRTSFLLNRNNKKNTSNETSNEKPKDEKKRFFFNKNFFNKSSSSKKKIKKRTVRAKKPEVESYSQDKKIESKFNSKETNSSTKNQIVPQTSKINKISKIPYRKKNNISYSRKKNQYHESKEIKEDRTYKDILEDSLDSKNTVFDEFSDNRVNTKSNNNDYLPQKTNSNQIYKKIIMGGKYEPNKKLARCWSNKNQQYKMNDSIRSNTERTISKSSYYKDINNKYKKSPSQNNISTNNFIIPSHSSQSTRNQTNRGKNKINVIINKDVTEFIYYDDLTENKDINLNKWLTEINLSNYYPNFYNNNIFDINDLIDEIKKVKNKNLLYEFIENNFDIHLPGHIFRILCKIEIDQGLFHKDLVNFLINGKNKQNLSNEEYIGYEKIYPKDGLKIFLKKYTLMNLYYNFYQNGFDLINFVLLQMFSKNLRINDHILENYFYIYNSNERLLLLKSLENEKNKINSFLNSRNQNNEFKYDDVNLDKYFYSKEANKNGCDICTIF